MDSSVAVPPPISVSSPPTDPTIVEVVSTTDTDALWSEFNKFYNKNEKAIEKCMKTDVRSIALDEKVSNVELQIDTFSETTKVVLDGLAGLGKIHPIIGAAIIAFHAVISLDMSRRDNDRKVVVIMLEMQNMMCAMFQLRHLKHTHVQESERDGENRRLRRLIESITADIIQCGSDLNYYLGQRFAFRLIKSKNFEQRFKTHVDNFARRRSELQSTITAYIAGGVDHANVTIAAVSMKLDHFFEALLRKLDTPQEREAFRFFEQNNGVENCVSKDELLVRLLKMTGDVLPDSKNQEGLKPDERIKKSREVLTDEVFEEALKQNMTRFDRLLTIQNNNHERVIAQLEKQEGYHEVTLSKLDKLLYYMHPDTKLDDPEVRRIWERMGLKTSVKAKNFVLTFRDHYQHDHLAPPTPNRAGNESPPSFVNDANGAQPLSLSTNLGKPSAGSLEEDPNAWLLEYIDVAHVRPIVEAMDADGSGFISVKEINTFAFARPKEWSLLQWMVYWAAGWHINITQYRDKIYDILIQMHELLPLLHPANRVLVDVYLDGYSMHTIESILRCTKTVTAGQPSQITTLAKFYGDAQEMALRTNLNEVSYVISSVADATLVAGPARAESWIYPLLYLLLERHLAVLELGKTIIYNSREIYTHWVSLESVLAVFERRKDALTAMFSQIYLNVAGRFETFAYGMLYPLYKEDAKITPEKNTLIKMRTKRSTRELILEMRSKREVPVVPPDTTILALEKGAPFEFEDLNVYGSASVKTDQDLILHPLEGYWSVTFFDSDGDLLPGLGLFHFVLSIASDGSITGSGEAYMGKLHVVGTAAPSVEKPSAYSLKLKIVDDKLRFDLFFHGTHNAERDVVTGSWGQVKRPQETPPEAPAEEMGGAAQDGGSNEAVQDIEPGQDFIAPSDGTTDVVDTNKPSEQETRADTVVEDAQTPKMPDGILDGEKQADPTDTSTHNDAGIAERNGQTQKTTDETEGSNETISKDNNYSGTSEPCNTFSMRRTPADLYRFRRNINLDVGTHSSVLVKNRWKFAIEATKFQVQIKNFSWEYVRARLAERRSWLDFAARIATHLLPNDRSGLVFALAGVCAPPQSRLYNTTAVYLNPRGYPFKIGKGVTCDYCGREIVCHRYMCITCMTEDLSNQIDLCTDSPKCIENTSSNPQNDFVHSPSHTLLLSKFWLHKMLFPQILVQCRERSDNIKKKFRTLEKNKKMVRKTAKSSKSDNLGHSSQIDEAANVQPLYCVCCEKEVSLPCWICASCDTDAAICLECKLKRAKVVTFGDRDTMHSHDHLLLRISDSAEVQSREINNVRLQRELINIATDLRSLDQKLTAHLRAASKVMRRSTSDGEVTRVSADHNTNGAPVLNAEATATTRAIAQDTVNEEDDDDISDTSGSIYPSDTENKVRPNTSPSAVPQHSGPVNADTQASGQVDAAAASSSKTDAHPIPEVASVKQGIPVTVLPIAAEASMITPTPANARFFGSSLSVPVHSGPPRNANLSEMANEYKSASEPDSGPPAVSVEPSPPTSESRQFAHHLLSIDTRISSLETHVSSLGTHISSVGTHTDTRILALDNRLSGLESQLGEILSLLRQSRS